MFEQNKKRFSNPFILTCVLVLKRIVSLNTKNICFGSEIRKSLFTVLPAKSDSDLKVVYKVIRDLCSINPLCINPILRMGLIHK